MTDSLSSSICAACPPPGLQLINWPLMLACKRTQQVSALFPEEAAFQENVAGMGLEEVLRQRVTVHKYSYGWSQEDKNECLSKESF